MIRGSMGCGYFVVMLAYLSDPGGCFEGQELNVFAGSPMHLLSHD